MAKIKLRPKEDEVIPPEPDDLDDNPPDFDDPELAKQAEISDGDVADAVEFWREKAPEGFEELMEAKSD